VWAYVFSCTQQRQRALPCTEASAKRTRSGVYLPLVSNYLQVKLKQPQP
jgi:hypothetical protein